MHAAVAALARPWLQVLATWTCPLCVWTHAGPKRDEFHSIAEGLLTNSGLSTLSLLARGRVRMCLHGPAACSAGPPTLALGRCSLILPLISGSFHSNQFTLVRLQATRPPLALLGKGPPPAAQGMQRQSLASSTVKCGPQHVTASAALEDFVHCMLVTLCTAESNCSESAALPCSAERPAAMAQQKHPHFSTGI